MTVVKDPPMRPPTGQKKRPKPKEPSLFWVIVLSGFLSGMLLFVVGWYMALPDTAKNAFNKKVLSVSDIFPGVLGFNRSQMILVMGVDMPPLGNKNDYQSVRTDTIMLVKLDHPHHAINIVSIPRDSKVFIPGHGTDKINSAFTYGGPELTMLTVKQTFGIDIDQYMVINLRGVKEVVDTLGGIDVYVEKPMHYRDMTAKLNINLEPGLQHMDGPVAEGFLRFRHDAYGDIGRIRRQQQFIKAMSQKIKDPAVLLKLKPLIDASSKYLLTNMSTQDLVRTVLFAKDLNHSKMQVATLPGGPSLHSQVSYWIIDPHGAEEVLNRLIVGTASSDISETEKTPSVGILYTAQDAEIAKAYKAKLLEKKYKITCEQSIGQSASKVVTHSNRFDSSMAATLQSMDPSLNNAQMIFAPHGTTYERNACGPSDFTVIFGDDLRRQ